MKRTNQEITAQNKQIIENMIKSIKNMDEKEYQAFLEKMSVFHNYSFNNQIILYCSGAVNVKGFQQWKQIGRTVKKGSEAIWILAPLTYKKEVEKESGEKEIYNICKGFKSVPVFDYKDTEGKELPKREMTVASKITLDKMIEMAKIFGFAVNFKEMKHSCGGSINREKEISLNNMHDSTEQTGTLLHEICHGLLDHISGESDSKNITRSLKE